MAVNGVTVIALEWGIFVPLATVFVLIRFIVRYLYPSKFTTIGNLLVALAFALFLLAPSLDTVTWQAGFYSDNAALETPVSSDSTVYGLKLAYSNWILFYVTLWVTKGAILSVYYQIIPRDSKIHRITLHVLSVASGMAFLTTLLLNLIWCRPIKLNWSLNRDEMCFAPFNTTVIVITGAIQVAIDVAIVILPFPLLLAVNASTGEKASIAAVFAMGVLSIAATVSRLIWSFATESLELYTVIARTELTVSMIVACSPALRVLATQTSANQTTASPSSIFASGGLGVAEPVSRWSRHTSSGTHASTATSLPALNSQRRHAQLDGRHFSLIPPLNLHHQKSNNSLGQSSITNQHLLHSQRSSLSGAGQLRSPGGLTLHTRDASLPDTLHSPLGCWPTTPTPTTTFAPPRPSNLTDRPSHDLIVLRTPSARSCRTTTTAHTRGPSNPLPPLNTAIIHQDSYATSTNHARGPSLTASLLTSCINSPPPPLPTRTTPPSSSRAARAPISPISPISLNARHHHHHHHPLPPPYGAAATGDPVSGPSPQPSIEDMYFGRSDVSVADLERDGFERLDVLEEDLAAVGGGGDDDGGATTGEDAVVVDEAMVFRAVGMALTTGEGERVSGMRGEEGGEDEEEGFEARQQRGADSGMEEMADWAELSWGPGASGWVEEEDVGRKSGGAQGGWVNGKWRGKGVVGDESMWV